MTENEMVGWHHQLNGNEFEQAPEDGEGQGGLVGCSPWDPKESDMAEQLNNNNKIRSRNKKNLVLPDMQVVSYPTGNGIGRNFTSLKRA